MTPGSEESAADRFARGQFLGLVAAARREFEFEFEFEGDRP